MARISWSIWYFVILNEFHHQSQTETLKLKILLRAVDECEVLFLCLKLLIIMEFSAFFFLCSGFSFHDIFSLTHIVYECQHCLWIMKLLLWWACILYNHSTESLCVSGINHLHFALFCQCSDNVGCMTDLMPALPSLFWGLDSNIKSGSSNSVSNIQVLLYCNLFNWYL